MQQPLFYVLWLFGAYLLGSLSAGDLVARAAGLNVRALGNGNPGTANIYRKIGPRCGVMVLVLDVVTGAIVTLPLHSLDFPKWMSLLAVAAVLIGHIFPVFWGFRGGVGGAVGIGTTLGLLPLGALIAAPLVTLVLVITRTPIYSVWLFFGITLLAGGLLHQDATGVMAVLLAMTVPTMKWIFQYRIKSISDIRKALGI